MQRSGQHAIMQWLMQGYENVRAIRWTHRPFNRPLSEKGKESFFINFENIIIPESRDDIVHDSIQRDHTFHTFVILRDPFNLFASRMTRHWKNSKRFHPVDQQRDLWINHATEYLSEKTVKGVSYNKWVSSETYRESLCSTLNLPLIPRMEKVPGAGSGSSFDKQTLTGYASKMKIFERWKELEDELFYDKYKQLFTDDVIDLSIEAFGKQFVFSIINSVHWNAS